jgi:hypothetical protein
LIICGLLAALSTMVIDPALAPVAVGVKLTAILQFPLGATDRPQVLVCEKSPVEFMAEMDRRALPVLLNVTNCGAAVVVVS